MDLARIIVVWLHILAAIILIGGRIFWGFLVMPGLKRLNEPSVTPRVVGMILPNAIRLAWVCLIFLVLSGVSILLLHGYGFGDFVSGQFWQDSYAHTLGTKLLLVALVFVLSALLDFKLGPQAMALQKENPQDERIAGLQKRFKLLVLVNLSSGLLIVLLGVILARGGI